MKDSQMSTELESNESTGRKRREAGSGCLIPPRLGISKYWTVQVRDVNGKLVRRTRLNSGFKVKGELKPGCDPKLPESWTNISAARVLLKEWLEKVGKGDVSVGHDPSQLHYAHFRVLYLHDYAEQGHKSLRKHAETGVDYVDCLPHLDKFMGYEQEGDEGIKVSSVTVDMIDKFKTQRKAEGASNATINRSLGALRRMFALAIERGSLKYAPFIKMLPEAEARTGFLEVQEYDKLYEALPDYVKPILQIGFYTGMRLGEIKNLTWSHVDLANNVIRLEDQDVKNSQGREIPLIDGLPNILEKLRQANPTAEYVFLGVSGKQIKSFRKAWARACETAGLKNFLFHDLRRSAVRNLVRAGVPRGVAMKITGHKTEEVFERYNITDSKDIKSAGESVAEYLNQKRLEAAQATPKPKLKLVSS